MKTHSKLALLICSVALVSMPDVSAAQEVPVPVRRDQPPARENITGFQFGQRLSFELTFGVSLNESRYRVDTGGGTFQDFGSPAGAGTYGDLRFTFNDLIPLNDGDGPRGIRSSIFGGIGFQTFRSHVDFVENVGGVFDGVVDFGYEGTTKLDSPYLFAGITFSSDDFFNPFSDLGGGVSFGVNVGLPPIVTKQDGGGFRDETDDEVPISVDAFYNFKVSDNVTVAPGLIVLFNSNGEGDDTALIGALRTKFTF